MKVTDHIKGKKGHPGIKLQKLKSTTFLLALNLSRKSEACKTTLSQKWRTSGWWWTRGGKLKRSIRAIERKRVHLGRRGDGVPPSWACPWGHVGRGSAPSVSELLSEPSSRPSSLPLLRSSLFLSLKHRILVILPELWASTAIPSK